MSDQPDHNSAGAADNPLTALEAVLGHRFNDPALVDEALTHPSLEGAERGGHSFAYQRLEFLGDRVLGLLIAALLLRRFPREAEGTMARRHTALVRKEMLADVAREMGLGPLIRMSPAEDAAGGRDNDTTLSDVCEAVLGALFLDAGLAAAEAVVTRYWAPQISHDPVPQDPKSRLQEWAQGRGLPLPVYEVVDRTGPAHQPQFRVKVLVANLPETEASGTSKRAAEKAAAQALLAMVADDA